MSAITQEQSDGIPILYSPEDVAKAFGVHPATLVRWRAVGEGPAWIQINPVLIRYLKSDVEAFILKNRVGGKAAMDEIKAKDAASGTET